MGGNPEAFILIYEIILRVRYPRHRGRLLHNQHA